jgi:ATP-dependent DNA helicase RecQ
MMSSWSPGLGEQCPEHLCGRMRSVAEHIAAVGRLPLAHALMIGGPPTAVADASAVRVKDLLYRTALAPGVSFTGPLLLVDNTIRTRWDSDRAPALLADAGAP